MFYAALLVFVALGFNGCGEDYSRTKFKQMVMNKTEAQVKEAVGEPLLVKDGKWYYFRITFDSKNDNKEDYKASLTFKKDPTTGQNVVSGVEFFISAGS